MRLKVACEKGCFFIRKITMDADWDSVDDDDAMFIRQIDAIKDINCAFIETRKGMKLI